MELFSTFINGFSLVSEFMSKIKLPIIDSSNNLNILGEVNIQQKGPSLFRNKSVVGNTTGSFAGFFYPSGVYLFVCHSNDLKSYLVGIYSGVYGLQYANSTLSNVNIKASAFNNVGTAVFTGSTDGTYNLKCWKLA